jgi:hypothetical protein
MAILLSDGNAFIIADDISDEDSAGIGGCQRIVSPHLIASSR